MKRTYIATKGAPFPEAKAQVFGITLEKIADKKNGILKPRDVVEDARKISSPLHRYFDWKDTSAAEKYRLYQARLLINHIEVVVKYDHGKKTHRAYLSVNETPGEKKLNKIYVTIERVLREPELRSQILRSAMKEVEYWYQKYKEYEELSKIFQAIKKTKRRLTRKKRRRKK